MRWALLYIMMSLLLLAAVPGCKSSEEASEEGLSSVDVRVINRNWLAMEVYVVAQSRRVRLGRLRSGDTQTYDLPADFLKPGLPIQFEMVNVDQTKSILSDPIIVVPGEEIVLVIPNER